MEIRHCAVQLSPREFLIDSVVFYIKNIHYLPPGRLLPPLSRAEGKLHPKMRVVPAVLPPFVSGAIVRQGGQRLRLTCPLIFRQIEYAEAPAARWLLPWRSPFVGGSRIPGVDMAAGGCYVDGVVLYFLRQQARKVLVIGAAGLDVVVRLLRIHGFDLP